MVSEVKKKKMDIYFKKLIQRNKNNLKLVIGVEGLKEKEFKLMEEQFKKCDYLIMLNKDGGTQTIRFG